MRNIYLDNSATTMVYPEVADLMHDCMVNYYGNPSSTHGKGLEAKSYVDRAYKQIAKALKCEEKEIIFTSGGTESDNLALIGGARANMRAGKHIITTCIEHPAILKTVKYLESEGFEIDYLGVNEYGVISLDELKSKLRPDTILVSMMHTNNEVGSLQPIKEAGEIIKANNKSTLFHVDAVQGFGKAEIYPGKINVDLMSISSHKIHGPKGMGVLYVKKNTKIKPISYGGGQQGGMRNGTLNVPGIAGMGLAVEKITGNLKETRESLYELKRYFFSEVSKVERVSVNGCRIDSNGNFLVEETAPHIMNISVRGLRSETMLNFLTSKGVYVSAGSACSANSKVTSSTLKAMGKDGLEMDGALRFSMSEFTTEEDMREAIEALKETINFLNKTARN